MITDIEYVRRGAVPPEWLRQGRRENAFKGDISAAVSLMREGFSTEHWQIESDGHAKCWPPGRGEITEFVSGNPARALLLCWMVAVSGGGV